MSGIEGIIRRTISNIPRYAPLVVNEIFSDDGLKNSLYNDIDMMADSLNEKRNLLNQKFKEYNLPYNVIGSGLFTIFNGLTSEQINVLAQEHGIVLVDFGGYGRLNVGAINKENVGRFN